MLILTRTSGQSIQLSHDITVTVTSISGGQVKIGIDAPDHINIVRSELSNNDTSSNKIQPISKSN